MMAGQVNVVSAMLLCAIVVTLGVSVCLWAYGTLEASKRSLAWEISYLERSVLTKLALEDVWFCNETGELRVFVTNVGELEATVDAVIVDGRLWASGLGVTLGPLEGRWVNVTFPDWFTLRPGLHEVAVVTEDGLKFRGVVVVGG